MINRSLLFLIFIFTSFVIKGQGGNRIDSDNLKLLINRLYKENKIFEVNRMINKNDFSDLTFPLQQLEKNRKLAIEVKNKKWLADTYLSLGIFWIKRGDGVKAYQNFINSEKISKEVGDQKRLGMSLINQANLENNIKKKIEKFEEAVTLLEKQQDRVNIVRSFLNMGYAYFEKFHENLVLDSLHYYKAKSTAYYRRAETHLGDLDNIEMLALLEHHKGLWFQTEKEHEKALIHLLKSKELFRTIQQVKWQVILDIAIAKSYLEMGKNKLFLSYLLSAEKSAETYNINDYLTTIYDYLRGYYKDKHDLVNELKFSELYFESLIEQEKNNSNAKLMLLEAKKNLELKEESLINLKERQKNYFIIFSISILLLIIGILIIYLLFKNNKVNLENVRKNKTIMEIELENNKLKEEVLLEKDRLNKHFLSLFVGQGEAISNFIVRLAEKLKNNTKLELHEINQLKIEYNQIIYQNEEIKSLYDISQTKVEEFLLKIKKLYPYLSQSDLKLLSLLYKNKESKEIANILQISPASVNTKRYRLRQKLQLQKDCSFNDFFNMIVN